VAFLDADDFLWVPTDRPYQAMRPHGERKAMLEAEAALRGAWALGGSVCGWGDDLARTLTLAVFVAIPAALPLDRLRARERARFGAALDPGGAMHVQHGEFMAWAARYDGGLDVRSRAQHAAWMGALVCPVLRLEGDLTREGRVERVLAHGSAKAVSSARPVDAAPVE